MGASAGGLEAFQKFFAHTPAESGMAFVIAVHLDPRHDSLMPELLGRVTAMPAEQIRDDTRVEPNHIYVIPANAALTIEAGTLKVVKPAPPDGRRTPIDTLFRSLAEDQGANAVCILLSGSGTDGTLGLRAVKEHGGMTMAQSPESAHHDSIVRSAIATGMVDYVLPPDQLPAKLVDYAAHMRDLRDSARVESFAKDARLHLRSIWEVLRRKTGHDFSRYKQATVMRRIQRRMQVLQVESVADYVGRLRNDAKEAEHLFKDLLIGVTHFFRDPDAFDALAREVIPRLFQAAGQEPIRVWIPGCATAEEPYSVAILLREAMRRLNVDRLVRIFAGDIDDAALELARQGRYPEGIAEHVSQERLDRFFVKHGSSYEVVKHIRDMCIFSQHSVIKDPPFSRLDLIVCRNLLIYLEPEPQRQLASLFHYALRPRGYLFLGSSESLDGPAHLFRTVDKKHRLFQRNETIVSPPLALLPPRLTAEETGAPRRSAQPGDAPLGQPARVQALERLLLENYAPAWVVIDRKGDAVYFSPRTGRYLEPAAGVPSSNLVDMARKGLRLELRAAVHNAVKTGKAVVHPNLRLKVDGEVQRLNLVVRPLSELEPEAESSLFMVVFQELETTQSRDQAVAGEHDPHAPDTLTLQLENELRTTRETLQATVEELETSNEELKSSNEELLSTNEELQSANEELQTSKEELQSLNEELETINEELGDKIEALGQANSDLDNLFHSTRVPTIFLDRELRIRKFTQATSEVLRVIDTDVGRPVLDVAARFPSAGLEADVHEVLRTLTPRVRRIRLEDGSSTYVMRIMPYRQRDNIIEGVVITFTDVTQLDQALEQRSRLAAIVESSQDAIVGTTLDGVVSTWNAAAHRMLGYSEAEAIGAHVTIIVPPERREEAARATERLKRGESIPPHETTRQSKDGQRIQVSVAISLARDAAEQLVVAYAFRDITELTRGRESLREEARRKDAFLTSLSHELRNPLAPLRNCVEVLRHAASGTDAVPNTIEMMDRQVSQLTRQVDQLLDASRISSGRIELDRRSLDLTELIRRTAEDYRPTLESAGLELDVTLPGSAVWVRADAGRLSQVVANLLGNARKFTNSGGKITLALEPEARDGMAALSVRDTGIGMELELLGRLFTPFAHGPGHAAGTDAGLGLGLALVKGLIEAHQGTVHAWSDGPGRGSELTVRLPLEKGHAIAPKESLPVPEPTASPRRILILEDNPDTAASMKLMLEMAGHQAETVSDGRAALAKAAEFQPDALLCDIGLPGEMDGYAVAGAFRRDPALESTYLIALTGYGRPEDKEQARRFGFNLHLTKPANPMTLKRLLARIPPRPPAS